MKYRIPFLPALRLPHSLRRGLSAALLAVAGASTAIPAATGPASGEQVLNLSGEWRQGAVIKGQVPPGAQVEFAGRILNTTPGGQFVLGLGRDAAPQAEMRVTTADGAVHDYDFEVAQREYVIQRIEGVKQKHVTPPKSVTRRIRDEAEQVYLARQIESENRAFLQAFEWPLAGPVTGVYGSQRFYNGQPRSPHYGIDIAAPTGTPVKAPAAGVVSLAHDDMYYSGGTLILDHGYGLSSTFIHLHKVLVAPGERVEQGQVIAQVGASGRATGPHLDWRLNWFNERLDPQLLMAAQGQPAPPLAE